MERRVGQRFPFLLPVCFRDSSANIAGVGFTQDVSSRGVFFFTDTPLEEGREIELTLQMPAEITLGESMRVRCRGHILRVIGSARLSGPPEQAPAGDSVPTETCMRTHGEPRGETKIGVAVRLEGYEYLPESDEASATFQRLSPLHGHKEDEHPLLAHVPARSVHG
jgi:hypothetical protein